MTTRSILHVRLHRVPFALYGETFALLGDITPAVQALPPESALLDVTGALGYFDRTPEGLADLVATRLLARFGLHAAIGGGDSPLLAGLAADTCAPGQTRILGPGTPDTGRFLRSRPVEALPGIGPKLARALARFGITTVGELADLPLATVQRIAGTSTGRLLHERANGHDPRTVVPSGPPAGITAGRRFPTDVLDPDRIRRTLLDLATDLGFRLRTGHKTCRALELQITYADRTGTTRTRTLREPTAHTPHLADTLYGMFAALGLQRARIRAVTARVAHLAPAATGHTQLTLDPGAEDRRTLEPVIDRANHRWGTGTLRPAALTALPSPGGPRRHRAGPAAADRRPYRAARSPIGS
ncbi:helix-hairpin-helix domain-containing protein [Kitasatospora sp. NPDC059571]|uniref:DNA polymerase Y family protein n=1 Tax=Kitasatospora sp. NPDC059571 TaxID=3346871 RepID=UPI0036942B27